MLKIPLGKHTTTGRFFDAGSVPRGRACNCICHKCGQPLESVHATVRRKYFRHISNPDCDGALESLFHKVAKQILKESSSIHAGRLGVLHYDRCDIETPRYGRRPDAYITGLTGSLIVEVVYTHKIEPSTLDIYLQQQEQVLEIDISQQRSALFNYEYLKELILFNAPRKLYPDNSLKNNISESKRSDWEWVLPIVILLLVMFLFWRWNKYIKK